jgi:hypothetical protein
MSDRTSPETRAMRDRRLSKTKQSKGHQWPPADRDAELDEALRELGDEMLDQEIPERLLQVLRSGGKTDKSNTPDRKGKRDAS